MDPTQKLHLHLPVSDILTLSSCLNTQIEQNKLLIERTPRLADYAAKEIIRLSTIHSLLSNTLSFIYDPKSVATDPATLPNAPSIGTQEKPSGSPPSVPQSHPQQHLTR